MSVITRFSVYTHCNDLGGKVWNPAIRWTKKYAVFVVLENDSGVQGLGECWCFDSRPDALIAYLKTEIAPLVIGSDLNDLPAVSRQLVSRATLTARHGMLASAWSGVDIAQIDMQSREAGLPLWRYLQQQNPNLKQQTGGQAKVYGSAGLYGKDKSTDDLVAEMRGIEAMGFDLLKMKVGGLSIEQDIDRVEAVLAAVNESTQLIIDGVYSYTVEESLMLYKQLPSNRITAFQSPLSANDLSGMQLLCKDGVPVMGTEAEYRHELHSELISTAAVRYLQVAPIAVGGISRVLELSGEVCGPIKLSLEVSSTAVAFATACQLSRACSNIAHVEYHFVHQVFFDELQFSPQAFINHDNNVVSGSGHGIGIDQINVELAFTLSA